MDQQVLKDYYAKRAGEFEEVYYRDDPVRQKAQAATAQILAETFRGKSVLEVACGTGYWTYFVSQAAKSIVATDINQEMLDLAKQKSYGCPVTFAIADAYHLPYKNGEFNGGLANFWFSHIPKQNIEAFLREFHRVLAPQSPVFMGDNVLLPEEAEKVIHKATDVNTYRNRTLKDGSIYEVLKNYYTPEELIAILKPFVPDFSQQNCVFDSRFWSLKYRT